MEVVRVWRLCPRTIFYLNLALYMRPCVIYMTHSSVIVNTCQYTTPYESQANGLEDIFRKPIKYTPLTFVGGET